MNDCKKNRIALVSPFPPPYGGMSILSETLQKNLESHGQIVTKINTHPTFPKIIGKWRITKVFQFIIFLVNLLKAIFCDVIIVVSSSGRFFYYKALPALWLGIIFNMPVILDFVGGGIIEEFENGNLNKVKHLNKFDKVLVPTNVFKSSFEKVGVESIVFPHIVDIERFNSISERDNFPVFLAAKNLVEYSNVSSLIKAFAEVKKKAPDARFIIAGDGPEKGNLLELVKDLNIPDIDFVGNVTYSEMPSLFSKATIFLHGTRHESFGIVLVEAMASGTPVISTNVGGIPDLIQNGINGILVDYNDSKAIAEKVLNLLHDKVLYEKLKMNGIKYSKTFSGAALTARLLYIVNREIENYKLKDEN